MILLGRHEPVRVQPHPTWGGRETGGVAGYRNREYNSLYQEYDSLGTEAAPSQAHPDPKPP